MNGNFYLFMYLLLQREERVDLFLKWVPNIWDGHAPEDNGEDVMMACQGWHVPRIRDKFLNITKRGVIGFIRDSENL